MDSSIEANAARMAANVAVLSAKKQRRSLGESGKREKAVKRPTRTTVVNPNDTEWPDIDDISAKEVLLHVESALKCLRFPVRHCPLSEIKSVPKENQAEHRRRWIAQQNLERDFDVTKYTSLRKDLRIGVNSCQLAMEVNELAALIIEKNVEPQIITKLLVPIANSKSIPVISLVGLKTAVKKGCNINCIALGLKRECEDVTNRFYPLLTVVLDNAPLFDVSLQFSQEGSTKREEDSSMLTSGDDVKKVEMVEKEEKPSDKKFSIEAEVEMWERRVYGDKRKAEPAESDGKPYVNPKVRKITPQQK